MLKPPSFPGTTISDLPVHFGRFHTMHVEDSGLGFLDCPFSQGLRHQSVG